MKGGLGGNARVIIAPLPRSIDPQNVICTSPRLTELTPPWYVTDICLSSEYEHNSLRLAFTSSYKYPRNCCCAWRYTKEQKYLQFLSFIYHWISGNREWILENFYYFSLKSSRVNFLDKDYKKRLIIIIIIFLIYRVKEIKMCEKDVENWIDEF